MASIDVGIHPDPAGITTKHYPGGPPSSFSTLRLSAGESNVTIYVRGRAVLGALYDALDEIRLNMGKAEQAAMAAKRTARAEEIRADMAQTASVFYDGAHEGCDTNHRHNHSTAPLVDALTPGQHALVDAVLAEAAQTASDQVPTVMADWPAGPPGEAVEVFGK
jgi:hypothetical protein